MIFAALTGNPLCIGRHAHLIGQGRVIVANHGTHGVGAVAVVIAGGAAADIGGIFPANRVRRGGALESLVQCRVVPLHAGIDIGNHNAVALHPKGRPKTGRVGVGYTPIQGMNAEIKEVPGQNRQGVNRGGARVAHVSHRFQRGDLAEDCHIAAGHGDFVAREEGLIFHAVLFQDRDHRSLRAGGCFFQGVVHIPAALIPICHPVSLAQVGVFRHFDDIIRAAMRGKRVQNRSFHLFQPRLGVCRGCARGLSQPKSQGKHQEKAEYQSHRLFIHLSPLQNHL